MRYLITGATGFGIKEAGFEVGFILNARAYHLGDRSDNR